MCTYWHLIHYFCFKHIHAYMALQQNFIRNEMNWVKWHPITSLCTKLLAAPVAEALSSLWSAAWGKHSTHWQHTHNSAQRSHGPWIHFGYTHEHTHSHCLTHLYTHIHSHTQMHAGKHTHTHTHARTHTFTCVHLHLHMHTHTHSHKLENLEDFTILHILMYL